MPVDEIHRDQLRQAASAFNRALQTTPKR